MIRTEDEDREARSRNTSTSYAADIHSIREAHARIQRLIHTTQVQTCQAIDDMLGKSTHFKCENFQKGGAFKFRGASNAVFSLSDSEASRGVVTHSSGNHAGAVARAASIRGIPAYIIVPSNTPQCKLDAISTYGGDVVKCKPTMDAREEECRRIQEETGATFVPPYNHPSVISGQGTVGLEFLEQVPSLDAIIVPVSGGGLISGISIAAKSLKPEIAIFAAEPTGNNDGADCAASKAAGMIVERPKPHTIADGLQGRLGSLTWPPLRDLVSQVITVSDEEIVAAMQLIFERMKIVVEPSGAAALAAAFSPQLQGSQKWTQLHNIGIVLSGGNIDISAKGFWKLWKA